MSICGIYKYENLIDHKIYIGKGLDVEQRRRDHRSDAKLKKDNAIFHKALRKYKEENFSFEIIEECDSKDLDEREQYWISYYHSYIKDPLCKGYNMTPGGDGGQGEIFKKPVEQYDLQGKFIKEFDSASAAARELNIFTSNLTAACRGETSQCGGFQWKYKDDKEKVISAINFNGARKIEQYDFLGNFITIYNNAVEASKATGIVAQSITACCRSEVTFAGEYQWKYQNSDKKIEIKGKYNGKPIGIYDIDNNLIKIYPSISEASRVHSMSRNTILKALKNGNETHGFYWHRIGGKD